MDIKDLNKGQFLLLIILICFIVSIATSITTYSLLSEAPEEIKRPITQVVQKTVERIVEIEKENPSQLTKEESELLKDLKALKPLIDKLAEQKEVITDLTNTTTTTSTTIETENPNPETPTENAIP